MRLNTIEAGAGPPVVLLHGLFGAAANLGAVARALAAHHRVVSMDLRNHGTSPHAAEMTYPAMADDVAATMAALGLPRATVIGHSMGGKAAMLLALTQPARVERLAVLDIAPVTYGASFRSYAAAMQALPLAPGLTRAQAMAALEPVVAAPGVRAFLLQNLELDAAVPRWRIGLDAIAAAMPAIEAWPAVPEATPYAGPTLFLTGARSHYVREEQRPAIRALFPAARFVRVRGAGHWVHADAPTAVAATLAVFLGDGGGNAPGG